MKDATLIFLIIDRDNQDDWTKKGGLDLRYSILLQTTFLYRKRNHISNINTDRHSSKPFRVKEMEEMNLF